MSQIRVVLADDHLVVRAGIRMLLEQDPDIEVVGEADNGEQAIELVSLHSPDVLLLDMECLVKMAWWWHKSLIK